MSPFHGKVILITGAASGIGRELARQLSAEGAKIGGLDLQAEALASVAADLDGKPYAHAVADVTDRQGLGSAVRELETKLGPIDIVIAAAGIGRETLATADHAADTDAIIRINLIGLANTFHAVLPGMIERKRGQLVALSSLASLAGLPRMGAYCASKAGVNALCDAYRVELREHGIDVTILCPGFIKTPMTASIDPATIPGMMELPAAVRRMVTAIRARQAKVAFPTGSWFQVWLLRTLPRFLADWLAERHYRRIKLKQDGA